MRKIKKIFVILFIISLYISQVYANSFSNLNIPEKQKKIYTTAQNCSSQNFSNTYELIYKVYSEASEGEIKLKEFDNFSYYSANNWLVNRILPNTNQDVAYIYVNCATFGEQNDLKLLNINLIMANLKVGDILIFASKDSNREEVMLYVGNDENLGYDTLYCKNRKVEKLMLRYYLGQKMKNTNIAVRGDTELPLAGVARPLTYGGTSSYFYSEEKFYSDAPLEKYELKDEIDSSEIFTYNSSNVEYEDDADGIGKNNYQRIKDVLISSDNVIFNVIKLIENVGAIFLLAACIILGVRYMTCYDQARKVHLKKVWILLFLATILIFFARKIAIVIVDLLM